MTGSEQVRRVAVLQSPISGQVYGAANERGHLMDAASSALEVVDYVSLSDLQREIAGLHIGDFADSHPYDFSDDMRNGWNEALETVASRLGIDVERKD